MSYVHLHNHTEYSQLDGLSTCVEAAQRAATAGDPALAITDHGNCSGHPEHQRACDEAGIKPVFGMEAYFTADRRSKDPYSHLILLAADNQGLTDLWAASTEAFVTGHYNKPRIDWELLERYGGHWYATSACLGGPVSDLLRAGRWSEAGEILLRFKKILGPRFYLEIQSNALPEQIQLNRLLVKVGEALGIPLVAASDAHYPSDFEKDLHRLWMSCQTSPAQEDYWHYIHMMDEAETRAALLAHGLDPAVVDTAIRNSAEIAENCNARIEMHAEPPVFTRGGTHEDDARQLLDMCLANWSKVPNDREHRERLEREWQLVASKRMAGCYLMVQDVIAWTRAQGKLVGPGRGSAAGSLMSYLVSITTMDPIEAGLMFERFLTPGRTALPDFDMDYATSWRDPVTDYMIRRYGGERVIKVGTHTRYRNKGILNKLFSVMFHQSAHEWQAEARAIAGIIEEAESHTAGLGLPWDDILALPEIAELAIKYEAVFSAASRLVGKLYTYGQHPGGLVVSTDVSLAQSLPMRCNNKGVLVSQWDFRTMESLGLFKLDFLTLRTMDTIQETVTLIEKRTGQRIDPPSWDIEHRDPQVWSGIGTGHTAGMFQVETSLGQLACRQMGPTSLPELAALITYIRPGPRNSGMAASYLARRAGDEEVTYPHPDLAPYLESTYGVMLFQEDVLNACTVLAGYDGAEADTVRKILGKKQTEKIEAAGKQFIERCIERGHDEAAVTTLWEAMAEFAKYGFNRAHAYAYATLAYWTAWLKEHYPVELFTAILSTLDDKDRMAAYATDARRMGVKILPPDVRFCGPSFQPEGLAIRYGLSSIKGVGPQAIKSIVLGQPYTSYDDFRYRSNVDAGVLRALAKAGALDSLVPSRRALVQLLEADQDGSSTRCTFKDERVQDAPHGLPCTFDWGSEIPIARTGKGGRELKPLVRKPPKRCTVACRHYSPPGRLSLDGPEFSPRELWNTEQETYGCWMSDAVFAQIDELFGEGTREQARQIALGLPTWKNGVYPLLAVHAGLRSATTRGGNPMWWLKVGTEVSYISMVVFEPRGSDPDLYSRLRYLKQGTLIALEVAKDSYHQPGKGWRTSYRLADIRPLGG